MKQETAHPNWPCPKDYYNPFAQSSAPEGRHRRRQGRPCRQHQGPRMAKHAHERSSEQLPHPDHRQKPNRESNEQKTPLLNQEGMKNRKMPKISLVGELRAWAAQNYPKNGQSDHRASMLECGSLDEQPAESSAACVELQQRAQWSNPTGCLESIAENTNSIALITIAFERNSPSRTPTGQKTVSGRQQENTKWLFGTFFLLFRTVLRHSPVGGGGGL